ncbi:MAG: aminoacetone oxidase family FAD-binding enzyme [Leeuwenhoekiella sp.]|nr:aminoacetone oxidase family FAD-binding enzyme [Leeuwenhoekiella sp.]
MIYDCIIIGGGAAGFFTAINLARQRQDLNILILERGAQVLEKVRVSGGGRCNVTHAIFEPKPLTGRYPRGNKELLGPFHSFMSGDTMAWFDELGVALKIEEDGRIFPESDSSQTIIDCFLDQAKKLGIELSTKMPVAAVNKVDDTFQVETKTQTFSSASVVVATGSNAKMIRQLASNGLAVIPAVPSLFTFNIDDERITDLAGLATPANVRLFDTNNQQLSTGQYAIDQEGVDGPVLITHWGMSGPGILKLSAWAARELHACDYQFSIRVDWLSEYDRASFGAHLRSLKFDLAKQQVFKRSPFNIPKRLWQQLVLASTISEALKWADLSKVMLQKLEIQLREAQFKVRGKSTFKEEFVTAGGIDLKEIDFKTYQAKKINGLYLVGEILDIDAVTGGFNFQNAWTGGYIAAQALAQKL